MNEQRIKKVIAVFFWIIPVVLNVKTLGMISSDGHIEGIKSFYIWAFDIFFVFLGITVYAEKRAVKLVSQIIVTVLLIAGCVEIPCIMAYRIQEGTWHFIRKYEPSVFHAHPYLVGAGNPSCSISNGSDTVISHNRFGLRGHDFSVPAKSGIRRIAAIGGSSTYCVGVQDEQTWPVRLSELLPEKYEVINMGIPGYNTTEHIIQCAFYLSEYDVDTVLFYIGWNDVRNMHVKDLKPDYAEFHGKSQYANLSLPPVWTGPDLACAFYAEKLLKNAGWVHKTFTDTKNREGLVSSSIDEHALKLYRRNIRTLHAICKSMGITVVFIPQIMNYERLFRDIPYAWIPYIPEKDIKSAMAAYNNAMKEECAALNIPYASTVLDVSWKPDDFYDEGHFSAAGNLKFAETVYQFLKNAETAE